MTARSSLKGRSSRFATAALAAVAALSFAGGEALATSPTPASGQLWSPNQLVQYRWKEGDEPPTWMRAAVNFAAHDSNASRASNAAVLAQSDGGTSWIGYTADIPTTWAIGYTIGNAPAAFNMRLRPQGYPLDWGTLRWCQFYDSPPTGCYDAEMIALHELGHAQTLDHADETNVTDWTDTVMHAAPKTKAKAGWNAHEFGRCDVARLQIRYQPLDSTTPYSTCLDLNTQLSLSASASSAGYNSTITLTARLKVADDAIYPTLASDPLSARKVTLQQRAVGGASWTTVGAMSLLDYNGRYVKTITVTDTYDYRAVFATPGNEGLEGSTSLVVRVTVYPGGGCAAPGSLPQAGGAMRPCQEGAT
jgi:hypothetical protein